MSNEQLQNQYHQYLEHAVWAEVNDWTQIELTGSDRVKFLHNMSSNDIKLLDSGGGCELFLLTAQGKIVAQAMVLCLVDSLVLLCNNDQTKTIIEHLDRYLITEDVQIVDRTTDWGALLITGGEATNVVEKIVGQTPTGDSLSHVEAVIDETKVRVITLETYGPNSFLLQCDCADINPLQTKLTEAGVIACDDDLLEILRVESGTPKFGTDITSDNLPQEVARDKRAISFTKGCYIGQETVARIDALGHVNKYLACVKFNASEPENGLPEIGSELSSSEKVIGKVTSVVYSLQLKAPLALAYVRRGNEKPGTKLTSSQGECEVVEIPVWKS